MCASCSPHRITIPYQFIVQDTAIQGMDRRLESTDNQGGMKVRLCNPCVPDPNTLPPTPQGLPPSYYIATGDQGITLTEENIDSLERQGSSIEAIADRPLSRSRAFTAAGTLTTNQRRASQRADDVETVRHNLIHPLRWD